MFSDGSFSRKRPGTSNSGVYTPPSYSVLFNWAYNLGSRMSSHSWGASSNSCSSHSRGVDDYVHAHPDFVMLFAAGNDGDQGSKTIDTEVCISLMSFFVVCVVGISMFNRFHASSHDSQIRLKLKIAHPLGLQVNH